jgi:16S rRNA processing protein RimM
LNNKSGQKPEPPSDDFVVLGQIVRPHGLKGEVKISLLCSGLDRIVSCPSLRLVKDGKELKRLSVMRSFMHPDGDVIIRFKEIVGVDEAESLRGAQVAVKASEKAELPPDSFYLDDLMGLKVVTAAGEELGRVEEVMDGLANGVVVVRQGEKEILIPALKSVIREVDLKARLMVVDLPEEVDGDTAD